MEQAIISGLESLAQAKRNDTQAAKKRHKKK